METVKYQIDGIIFDYPVITPSGDNYVENLRREFCLDDNVPVTIRKKYGSITASFIKDGRVMRAYYSKGWYLGN